MRITKTGKKNVVYKFVCPCGCQFECDEAEVKDMPQRPGEEHAAFYHCPECSKTVGSVVGRRVATRRFGSRQSRDHLLRKEVDELREHTDKLVKAGHAMWLVLFQVDNTGEYVSRSDDPKCMERWMEVCSAESEDGHTKADCPKCEGTEHVQSLNEMGMCETCYMEEKERRKNGSPSS